MSIPEAILPLKEEPMLLNSAIRGFVREIAPLRRLKQSTPITDANIGKLRPAEMSGAD